MTDHFFSPAVTSVKQFSLLPFHVVQKPSFESFQVPSPPTPVVPCGFRVTLPSALNTIVNFVFESVEDVNGWPLKNSAWTSFGDSVAAPATLVLTRNNAVANMAFDARMLLLQGSSASRSYGVFSHVATQRRQQRRDVSQIARRWARTQPAHIVNPKSRRRVVRAKAN